MKSASLIEAMRRCFTDGEDLVCQLDDKTYVRRAPEVMNGSVGGHYRHILDHFRNLLEGEFEGQLDYDCRARNTPVETRRDSALAETRRLMALIDALDEVWFDRQLEVKTRIHYGDSTSTSVGSTFGREAVFCVMHAVHHYALIRVICGRIGCELPSTFGVAPSTVAATASCLQPAAIGRS